MPNPLAMLEHHRGAGRRAPPTDVRCRRIRPTLAPKPGREVSLLRRRGGCEQDFPHSWSRGPQLTLSMTVAVLTFVALADSYAQGGNYEILLGDGLAYCRVWARPDVSRDEGARLAQEQIAHSRALACSPAEDVAGFVMDLSDAPESWGPLTHEALVETVASWESQHRRVALMAGDVAIRRILARDVVRDGAPSFGKVCSTFAEAEGWLGRPVVGFYERNKADSA